MGSNGNGETEGISDLDEVHAISFAVYQVQASISALSIFGLAVCDRVTCTGSATLAAETAWVTLLW